MWRAWNLFMLLVEVKNDIGVAENLMTGPRKLEPPCDPAIPLVSRNIDRLTAVHSCSGKMKG